MIDARSVPRDPAALAAWLAGVPIADAAFRAELRPDPDHPYGRRVLVSGPDLEVMLATWTPRAACAPHDHGGAEGAVRVLAGRCVHRVYAPRGATLALVSEREHGPGDVLVAGRDLVHAMEDVGPEPLVTLHVYLPGIHDMVVYDVAGARTLVVAGHCGAWVPDPADVIAAVDGFVPPGALGGR